jgi:hypothetical protein
VSPPSYVYVTSEEVGADGLHGIEDEAGATVVDGTVTESRTRQCAMLAPVHRVVRQLYLTRLCLPFVP